MCKGQIQKEKDNGMLVSIQKVRLKKDCMLIYSDGLLFSTVEAFQHLYACPTCTNTHVHVYVQMGAVNGGLLSFPEKAWVRITGFWNQTSGFMGQGVSPESAWHGQEWRGHARSQWRPALSPQRAVLQGVLPYAPVQGSTCNSHRQGQNKRRKMSHKYLQ